MNTVTGELRKKELVFSFNDIAKSALKSKLAILRRQKTITLKRMGYDRRGYSLWYATRLGQLQPLVRNAAFYQNPNSPHYRYLCGEITAIKRALSLLN